MAVYGMAAIEYRYMAKGLGLRLGARAKARG